MLKLLSLWPVGTAASSPGLTCLSGSDSALPFQRLALVAPAHTSKVAPYDLLLFLNVLRWFRPPHLRICWFLCQEYSPTSFAGALVSHSDVILNGAFLAKPFLPPPFGCLLLLYLKTLHTSLPYHVGLQTLIRNSDTHEVLKPELLW